MVMLQMRTEFANAKKQEGITHAQHRNNRAADHRGRWNQWPDVHRRARLSVAAGAIGPWQLPQRNGRLAPSSPIGRGGRFHFWARGTCIDERAVLL